MPKTMISLTSSPTRRLGCRAAIAALCLVCASAGAHKVHDHAHRAEAVTIVDARAMLRAFRIDGDDTHLDAAWATNLPALERGDVGATLDAALIAQARHEFDRALALTRMVLERQPDNDQAWLLVNAIHLVRGDRAAARAACRELAHSSLLTLLTCQARAVDDSSAARALHKLESLLSAGINGQRDSQLAWSFSVAGDLAARTGQDFSAIQWYRRSLDLAESSQVRSALVDSLIRQAWFAEAQRALAAGSNALPLAVRRLIVARALGTESLPAVDRADRRFRQWIAQEDWLHAREMARFYLDVLPNEELAQKLARVNISVQREFEDQRLFERANSEM